MIIIRDLQTHVEIDKVRQAQWNPGTYTFQWQSVSLIQCRFMFVAKAFSTDKRAEQNITIQNSSHQLEKTFPDGWWVVEFIENIPLKQQTKNVGFWVNLFWNSTTSHNLIIKLKNHQYVADNVF